MFDLYFESPAELLNNCNEEMSSLYLYLWKEKKEDNIKTVYMYKGHMDKANECGSRRGVGWGGLVGRKWRQLYLNNSKKKFKRSLLYFKTEKIY